jgi:hypothetical protein
MCDPEHGTIAPEFLELLAVAGKAAHSPSTRAR